MGVKDVLNGVEKGVGFVGDSVDGILKSMKGVVNSRRGMLLMAIMPMVSSCEGVEPENSKFLVDPFVDVTSDARYSVVGNPNLSVTKIMNFGVVSAKDFANLNLVGEDGKVVYSLPLESVTEGCEVKGKMCKVAKFDLDQEFGGSVCEIPSGENSCVVVSGNNYKVELVGKDGTLIKPISGVIQYSPEKSVVDLSKKNVAVEEAEVVEVSNN